MILIAALLFLFVVTLLLTRLYINYAVQRNLLDIPNSRSSHTRITPRGGGAVFVGLWLMVCLVAVWLDITTLEQISVFFPGALLIAIIGFLDDRGHVAVRWRVLAHFTAAILAVSFLGGFNTITVGMMQLSLGWMGSVLAVFALIWSVNLFNFMDGTDGLAAIEAIFVFSIGGLLLWQAGGYSLAVLAWSLVACLTGFLYFNWPPAKLFMGDVGSGVLGFLVMAFAIAGQKWCGVSILWWLILYSVFLFDATITLLRRILAKEKWYEAHRSHAYQRLHQAGWSHCKILWVAIGANTIVSVLVVIASYYAMLAWWALLIVFILLLLVYRVIERIKPMYPLKQTQK